MVRYDRIEKKELKNDCDSEIFQNFPAELSLSESEESGESGEFGESEESVKSEGFEEASSIDSATEIELIRKMISDSNFYKTDIHQKIEMDENAPEKFREEKIRRLSESGKYTVVKPVSKTSIKDEIKPTFFKPMCKSTGLDQRKMENGALAQCLGVEIKRFCTGEVDGIEWFSIKIYQNNDETVHIQCGGRADAEVMLTENLELMTTKKNYN